MKKKFALIAVLAAALIFPFAVNVEKAEADAILFPWIVQDTNLSTVLSIVNTANGDGVNAEQLHYEYWFKPDTTNDQWDECQDRSFKRNTSKDDLVTFDAAGNINNGEPLFNDPGAGNVTYENKTFKMNVASPRRAFLIVDNNTPSFVNAGSNNDGTMYGEAMIFDISNGASWGYIAYNSSGGVTDNQAYNVSFADGLDMLGEVIGSNEETQTVILAPANIATKFFVTPIDSANQRKGNTETYVQLCLNPDQTGGCTEGGLFNSDEEPLDFERPKDIRCTTADDLSEFMDEGTLNELIDQGVSAWSYIVVDNADPDGAAIGKLEWTASGVTIDGTTIGGAMNNFLWLRDSETNNGPFGINYIHNDWGY